MIIDFPGARKDNPTQCIALTISDELIRSTIDQLNEQYPKENSWGRWEINDSVLHMNNTPSFADTVTRMVRISRDERGKAKDLMVGLTLKEMLIRLMQTQARHIFARSLENGYDDSPLRNIVHYIQHNLTTRIDLDKLADQACMSRASFFKKFKESMGETPLQYIMRNRINYAMELLSNTNKSVTEICYECGFQNLSHFITAFRAQIGLTPTMYKSSLIQQGKEN
jgi:AraC-like DNA-binding protein